MTFALCCRCLPLSMSALNKVPTSCTCNSSFLRQLKKGNTDETAEHGPEQYIEINLFHMLKHSVVMHSSSASLKLAAWKIKADTTQADFCPWNKRGSRLSRLRNKTHRSTQFCKDTEDHKQASRNPEPALSSFKQKETVRTSIIFVK